MSMQLKFIVTGQVISKTDTCRIVSGSKYVYTAAFLLPADYAEFTRIKAFFTRAEEELSVELTLNETTGRYESNVDDGLNLITGDYSLYLVGYFDDGRTKRLTAVMPDKIKVVSSGEAERDPLGVVDPTYIERVDTLTSIVNMLSAQAGNEVLATAAQTLSEAVNELKSRLDTANQTVASLIQTTSDAIDDLSADIQANTDNIGASAGDIDALQQTVSGHETTLGAHAQAIADNAQAAIDNAAGVAANAADIAGIEDGWIAFTPTLGWSGAIPAGLIVVARYKIIGKTYFMSLIISSTNGNGATGLTITNIGAILKTSEIGAECYPINFYRRYGSGAGSGIGVVYTNGDISKQRIYFYLGTTFPAGTNVILSALFNMEIE